VAAPGQAPMPAEAPAPAPAPAPAAKPAPPPPPMPAPVEQPGFLESMLEEPATLYGGGAALALLLGYGLLRSRKNRPASPEDTAMASIFPPDQNSVFGETGGQSVDTGSSSLIQTDFSQSGLSAIDADEGVDPVAEADVYMAYGRDAQAEEILLDAIKADPSRTAVHLKLLEIYAQRKNLQQFETTAAELYTVTGGSGEDWDKAVAMGRKLDPDNPLFSRPAMTEGGKLDAGGFTAPVEGLAAAGVAAVAAEVASDEPSDAEFDVDLQGDEAAAPEVPEESAAAEAVPQEEDELASTNDTSLDLAGSLDFSNSMPSPEEPSPSQLKDTWAIPGDLNQFTDSDLESLASSGPAEEVAETDDALDTSDLDFNLELDEAPEAEEVVASEATEEVAELDEIQIDRPFDAADSSLEFNLDLSEPPPASTSDSDTLAETRVNGLDPITNLEATDTGASKGIDFQSMLTDLEATDTGIPAPSAGGDDGEGVAVVDLEKTNFDGSLLDFDFELDENSTAAAPEGDMVATSLDLSDINLDLEGGDVDEAPAEVELPEADVPELELPEVDLPEVELPEVATPEVAVPEIELPDVATEESAFEESASLDMAPPADPDDDMASLTRSVVTSLTDSRSMPDMPLEDELNQEVDTKLELARAYEEMGDAEGARELLEEVLRDGDEAQQEQARSVLARLG
ncbi:MAG: hypothetical protein KDE68_01270, partial [Rhodocyclaceae bacterium]|nr:hypothetical protein [Rhodocyclaceae bacterium]